MHRFLTVLQTWLATIWWTGNGMIILVTAIAFGRVLTHDMKAAGDLAGVALTIWCWATTGMGLVMAIGLVIQATAARRNQFTLRAVVLALLAALVIGIHATSFATIEVASDLRDQLEPHRDERFPSAETKELTRRFDVAHDLSFKVYGIETAFMFLFSLGGCIIIARRMDDDA